MVDGSLGQNQRGSQVENRLETAPALFLPMFWVDSVSTLSESAHPPFHITAWFFFFNYEEKFMLHKKWADTEVFKVPVTGKMLDQK